MIASKIDSQSAFRVWAAPLRFPERIHARARARCVRMPARRARSSRRRRLE